MVTGGSRRHVRLVRRRGRGGDTLNAAADRRRRCVTGRGVVPPGPIRGSKIGRGLLAVRHKIMLAGTYPVRTSHRVRVRVRGSIATRTDHHRSSHLASAVPTTAACGALAPRRPITEPADRSSTAPASEPATPAVPGATDSDRPTADALRPHTPKPNRLPADTVLPRPSDIPARAARAGQRRSVQLSRHPSSRPFEHANRASPRPAVPSAGSEHARLARHQGARRRATAGPNPRSHSRVARIGPLRPGHAETSRARRRHPRSRTQTPT
jgi:hypothetical protein